MAFDKKEWTKQYREKNKIILREKALISNAMLRLKNPEYSKESSKKFREKNPEYSTVMNKIHYKENKEYYTNKSFLYNKNNKEKINKNSNKRTERLANCYVVNKLKLSGFPKESITPELIEIKRIILKTKRL
mgnify:CR=1 FL=1